MTRLKQLWNSSRRIWKS